MIMGGNETINQGSHWVTYETAFPTFENCRKDDTHSYTFQLLEANSYFGMEPTQVKLLKQELQNYETFEPNNYHLWD
nr:UDP-sugar pyrophosphorylase-like [Ziziphus jujuba var. spinosa]